MSDLPEDLILGQSPVILELRKLVHQVAGSRSNILIIGESGTGKELVARALHELSAQKGKPFIPINCGAIPENLIESELFGHQKGSFTGAVQDKPGLFELANKGTLFLDEVGELPLATQVKLLRALQERIIRKVGAVVDIPIDVRLISATNKNLEALVKKNLFREDLFYRLNVILIQTPALRERTGDIELLAKHFLTKFAVKSKKSIHGITQQALEVLNRYAFPGNVRELENMIERAVALESSDLITIDSLPESVLRIKVLKKDSFLVMPEPSFPEKRLDLENILIKVEKAYIEHALHCTRGNKRRAAELLRLTLRSLRYRMEKLKLEDTEDEAS